MRSMSLKLLALPLFMGLAGNAIADGRQAIIIANRSYETLSNVSSATSALALSQDLRAAEFEVSTFSNLDARAMRRALTTMENAIETGEEILVILSGHIASSASGYWLLSTDAAQPSALMSGDNALSIDALARVMSASGGSAVLLFGDSKLSKLKAPQGVTVFSGDTSSLVSLVRDGLLIEGRSIANVSDSAARGVVASGYLPNNRAFLSGSTQTVALPDGISERDIEDFLFAKAKAENTEDALSEFLQRYPTGTNARAAQRLLSDLTRSPTDIAREVEIALHLTRSEKQTIQSDLTLLGYDTNGVDGIFGRGTRAAVARWQAANGLGRTGYLTQAQISLIQDMATDARQQVERNDAAYWRQTGRSGTAEGYIAYLNRYPEGIFADLAKQELGELQSASEARAWVNARQINTEDGYRAFLDEYPNGTYTDEAQARLAELAPVGPTQAQIDLAKSQEDKAMANPIFRVLAEQRLAAAGFGPGGIDGRFDDNTREAIFQYQQANDLLATGYLDVNSINRLLND